MAENSVEHTDQTLKRFKEPIMATAAGVGAALVVVTLPHVYLESVISATLLSEMVPAAAPPLGNTARGLIAIMAGLVSASAIYFFLNRKGSSDMGVALREQINAASPIELDLEEEANVKKSRFSLPKFDAKSLTNFLKKPKKNNKARVMDLADLPQLRKIDSETAAPERAPLFAEDEAGVPSPLPDAIESFDDGAVAEEPMELAQATPAADMEPPVNSEPSMAVESLVVAESPAAAKVAPVLAEDLSGMNIAELADRLEAGLHRLKQLEAASSAVADISASAPAQTAAPVELAMDTPPRSIDPVAMRQPERHSDAPVAEQTAAEPVLVGEASVRAAPALKEVETAPENIPEMRQADMDAALKAALGTLEKMTAQR